MWILNVPLALMNKLDPIWFRKKIQNCVGHISPTPQKLALEMFKA